MGPGAEETRTMTSDTLFNRGLHRLTNQHAPRTTWGAGRLELEF